MVILLLHIPFVVIHHVQEDAYITFRTARHLAELGDFSFNLHQHYPGTTSLLYVGLVALIDLAFHSHMIAGVQLVGIICVMAGSYYGVRSFVLDSWELSAAWLLLTLWPVSLVVSYTGMETYLLILVLGMALFTLATGQHTWLYFCSLSTLPLIRPDAVAYGALLCLGMFLVERRTAIAGICSLFLGSALLLAANRWTSGVFLPGTIKAKLIAYHPDHRPIAIARRVYDLFLHQSFLLPVSTTYLVKAAPLVVALVAACFVVAFRLHSSYRIRVALATVAALATAIPLFYAVGGVIFDWYLYPANWLAMTVVVSVLVHLAGRSSYSRFRWLGIAALWIVMAMMQWARSLTASTQDYHYRADIGRYLQQISHGQGRLFLEPAGYIPYFSGIETDDEVGLVSDRILQFMQKDPVGWWIDYVKTDQPTYIVQREMFAHFETFEGYTLSSADRMWFQQHYRLIRRTHYEPQRFHNSRLAAWILRHGPMPDYLIYQRVASPASRSAP